jgi:DNA-binding winged helix-turn-helix (wHTH) protein
MSWRDAGFPSGDWTLGPSRSSLQARAGDSAVSRHRSFTLDIGAREVRQGTTRIPLSRQPFEILRLLLDRPGEVVRREEMARKLWPEGTYVDFEHSLNAAIKRLRAALGDDAQKPGFIETVPRCGYRWIHASTLRNMRLVVLPFTGPARDDAFVSGLAEELFAQLGLHGAGRLEVLSRRSALSRVGGMDGPSEAGASLGVDYVLEGSVRLYGGRVRIAVSLVDARRDIQTWSDIFERDVTEPVPMQIEIGTLISWAVVERVASA